MRIDRRLVLIGVMVIVLSMTMATQYATTRVGYSFGIVHPSDADIRFIGSDNSSDDLRVLRTTTNGTGILTIEIGDLQAGQRKNYTAAFGIVNEEKFSVNITHINVSGTNTSLIDIWLHGNRSFNYPDEAAHARVLAVEGGAAQYTGSSTMWVLGEGDADTSTMNASDADISTPWCSHGSNVRYSTDNTAAINGTSDFVWVGISVNVPTDATLSATNQGTIYIHFKSSTHD